MHSSKPSSDDQLKYVTSEDESGSDDEEEKPTATVHALAPAAAAASAPAASASVARAPRHVAVANPPAVIANIHEVTGMQLAEGVLSMGTPLSQCDPSRLALAEVVIYEQVTASWDRTPTDVITEPRVPQLPNDNYTWRVVTFPRPMTAGKKNEESSVRSVDGYERMPHNRSTRPDHRFNVAMVSQRVVFSIAPVLKSAYARTDAHHARLDANAIQWTQAIDVIFDDDGQTLWQIDAARWNSMRPSTMEKDVKRLQTRVSEIVRNRNLVPTSVQPDGKAVSYMRQTYLPWCVYRSVEAEQRRADEAKQLAADEKKADVARRKAEAETKKLEREAGKKRKADEPQEFRSVARRVDVAGAAAGAGMAAGAAASKEAEQRRETFDVLWDMFERHVLGPAPTSLDGSGWLESEINRRAEANGTRHADEFRAWRAELQQQIHSSRVRSPLNHESAKLSDWMYAESSQLTTSLCRVGAKGVSAEFAFWTGMERGICMVFALLSPGAQRKLDDLQRTFEQRDDSEPMELESGDD